MSKIVAAELRVYIAKSTHSPRRKHCALQGVFDGIKQPGVQCRYSYASILTYSSTVQQQPAAGCECQCPFSSQVQAKR
eukprot:scaffold232347_cov18-Tisochrysis_lutea.AAC.2